MNFLITLFARCMAVAVVAMPFGLFADINAQKTEQLPNVKFNFEKPAAEFKKAVDTKVKQTKKRAEHRAPKHLLRGVLKFVAAWCCVVLGIVIIIGTACIGPTMEIIGRIAILLGTVGGAGLTISGVQDIFAEDEQKVRMMPTDVHFVNND